MKARLLGAVLVLAFSAPVRAAEPPALTMAQLEKALERTDAAAVGRPMKVKTHAVVEKPNGGAREELLAETLSRGDGTTETKILLATKDGKDVTAERRAEEEKAKEKAKARAAKDEKKKSSLGLKIPTGSDRALFVLSEPKTEGGLLVADYEPVRGAKGDDLSRGRIGWDAASGEPAFLEAQIVNPPTGLKELHIRGEFRGAGDAIYTRLLRTTGVGGLLWIKRKFDITVEMEPVEAGAPAATPSALPGR